MLWLSVFKNIVIFIFLEMHYVSIFSRKPVFNLLILYLKCVQKQFQVILEYTKCLQSSL